jgi:FtsP/CotA-like multicopper oxidase with cupredoxin domain
MAAKTEETDTVTAAAGMPTKRWWQDKKIVLLIVGCVAIVLSLGLGLGLGLGLKKRNENESTALPNTRPSILQDPQEYILDPNWDLTAPNTTRYYVFNITEIPDGAPDGVPKLMFLVNGKFPGPVIEGNQGDRVVVQVNNFMTIPTSIHFHGQYQNGAFLCHSPLSLGTGFMDGTEGVTQCGIPPSQSFTYNFTLNPSGTSWWHAHYSTEYQDGILGPMIIHDRTEPNYNVNGDFIIMVMDWYHENGLSLLPGYLSPDNANTYLLI